MSERDVESFGGAEPVKVVNEGKNESPGAESEHAS